MPCTYCNNAFHTVADCDHPDSVILCANIFLKLNHNMFDFWEQYKILEPLTIGQLQIIMVTLEGPIDLDPHILIASIICLSFQYELNKNELTDKDAITCAVNRVVLSVKRTLPDTTEIEADMCNRLLRVDVNVLIADTTRKILPIVERKLHQYLYLNGNKSSNDVVMIVRQFGFNLFYKENTFNRHLRSLDYPEVYVDAAANSNILFEQYAII